MKLQAKPYYLLLFFAIILTIASLAGANNTVDINTADTYYTLDTVFVIRAIAMFLLLLWLLYVFTFKFLFSKSLAWLHIIFTITIAVVVCAVLLWKVKNHSSIVDTEMLYANMRRTRFMMQVSIAALMLSQLLFVINLFAGVIKKVN